MNFVIASIKFKVDFQGTKREAIREAKRLNEEYQPAFGTQVLDTSGGVVFSTEK